jgi:hypothetical protein
MGSDSTEPDQRRKLQAALTRANISTAELWLHYFSIGGSVGEYEVEAYLEGMFALPILQRDLLAMAANELFNHSPGPRAPYSDELAPGKPSRPDDPDLPGDNPAPP